MQTKVASNFLAYAKNDIVTSNQDEMGGVYQEMIETIEKYKRG